MTTSTETLVDLERLLAAHPEPWRIERVPYDFEDGTDHYANVVIDESGRVVSQYLNEDMAALIVGLKQHGPALITAVKEREEIEKYREGADRKRTLELISARNRAIRAEAEAARLRAALAEAREVMWPFARGAERIRQALLDEQFADNDEYGVAMFHLRRAAAFLAKHGGPADDTD